MSLPEQSPRTFHFGPFEADLETGELRKSGRKVRLQEKPFQILVALLEQPGKLVSREALRQRLWPADTFVDFDNGLNTAVNKLREALGDSADNYRYIETLARRGYRFVAPVEEAAAPAAALPEELQVVPAPPAPSGDRPLSPSEVLPAGSQRLITGVQRQNWMAIAPLAILVAAIFVGAIYLAQRRFGSQGTPPAGRVMLVVLPFEDMSGDPTQEYFSDGLTEEMIAELGRLQPDRLGVIARTSSMPYKKTSKSAAIIGRELKVQYILEGSVRRFSERVRITAQLIRVTDQSHLWAQSYDRDLRDILAVQGEVAQEVARQIALKLSPEQEEYLTRKRPVNSAAFDSYLQGRYFWSKLTVEGITRAMEYFQKAIQAEPDYAPAYSGLADCYHVLGYWDLAQPQENFSKAKAAARKALELDDTRADAHTSLGFVLLEYDWDRAGAEREVRRALDLNPNYPAARQLYAEYLGYTGHLEQARLELGKAQELDPLSLPIKMHQAGFTYLMREYDAAESGLREIIELDPGFALAYHLLGNVYAMKGRLNDSATASAKAYRLDGFPSEEIAGLERAYLRAGLRGFTLQGIQMQKRQSQVRYISPISLAMDYARLEDKDNAFAWLNRAYEVRHSWLLELPFDPAWDPIRSDPRFTALVKQVGFLPE